MKGIQIKPTNLSHLSSLAVDMRLQDRNEVVAATGQEPYDVLLGIAVGSRDTYTFLDNGYVIACIGIKPYSLAGSTASPWMLGTLRVPEYPRELLYYSKKMSDHWASEYDLLVNFVDARYTEALRWVAKLGFTVLPAQPYGPNNMPFHRVERRSR